VACAARVRLGKTRFAYDAAQGVRISSDPVGESGGINLYGYVGNDPVNGIDLLGLCTSEHDYVYGTGVVGVLNRFLSSINPLNPDNVLSLSYRTAATALNSVDMWYQQTTGGPPLGALGIEFPISLPTLSTDVAAESAEAVVNEGTAVYRVWGDGAGAWGRSWTTVDPGTISNFRDVAGLPSQNSGRFFSIGILNNAEGVLSRGLSLWKEMMAAARVSRSQS
jgi:uncharacterized protein RhaS with RHS repeats